MDRHGLYVRVLLATDHSERARDAARLAVRLADATARLRIVHVTDRAVPDGAALRALAREIGAERAELVERTGSPAKEIAREAESWRADLVALGARGHSPFERLLGSTADGLIESVSCDLLVARGAGAATAPAVSRVAAVTDFYDPGRVAAERALAIARAQGAELHVAHALDREPWIAVAAQHGFRIPGLAPPGAVGELESAMRYLLHRFNEETLDGAAKEHLLEGGPLEALLAFASDARIDLVAAGSRGGRGLGRRVVGSVAHGLVERAPCSVLLSRGA